MRRVLGFPSLLYLYLKVLRWVCGERRWKTKITESLLIGTKPKKEVFSIVVVFFVFFFISSWTDFMINNNDRSWTKEWRKNKSINVFFSFFFPYQTKSHIFFCLRFVDSFAHSFSHLLTPFLGRHVWVCI